MDDATLPNETVTRNKRVASTTTRLASVLHMQVSRPQGLLLAMRTTMACKFSGHLARPRPTGYYKVTQHIAV